MFHIVTLALTLIAFVVAVGALCVLVIAGLGQRHAGIEPSAEDDQEDGWLCDCGHWEESLFDCSLCGAEPPWGCVDDACQRHYGCDEDEDLDDYEELPEEARMVQLDRPCPYCGNIGDDCECVFLRGDRSREP